MKPPPYFTGKSKKVVGLGSFFSVICPKSVIFLLTISQAILT